MSQRLLNVGARFTVYAGLASTIPIVDVSNPDGRGLRIDWTASRTISSDQDTCSVTIFGLGVANLGKLQQAGKSLQGFPFTAALEFGWDGGLSRLMAGRLTKVVGPDMAPGHAITMDFSDGVDPKRNTPPGEVAVLVAATWLAIFQAIVSSMPGVTGLAPSFSAVLGESSFALQNSAFTSILGSNPQRDMTDLVSSLGPDYSWVVQDGLVYLVNTGLVSNNSAPLVLAPNTGLLTATLEDDGAAKISALGLPDMRPSQQIHVSRRPAFSALDIPPDQMVGDGPMRVTSISWAGSTDTGCMMDISARRVRGPT